MRSRFLKGFGALAAGVLAVSMIPQVASAAIFGVSGTISSVGSGPFAIALDPTTQRAYVPSYYGTSVTTIDTSSNAVVGTPIGVGRFATAIAVNPVTGTVYVPNSGDSTVSVISESGAAVTATINVGSSPEGVAVDPTTNTVYVTNYDDGTMSVINGATNTVTDTITLGTRPYGVAVDSVTGTVYVANAGDDTVSVINAATNTVADTIDVGAFPSGVAVDPNANTVYVTNYDGPTVSVINGATNTVTATVSVLLGPSGVAVDAATGMVYVANSGHDAVTVIDGSGPNVTATIDTAGQPSGVAIDPNTHIVYVTCLTFNSVLVITSTTDVPAAPAAPSAVPGNAQVALSWAAPDNGGTPITGYTVAYEATTASQWTTLSPSPATATSMTISSLTNGTLYSFKVLATNGNGDGPYSDVTTATPMTVPATPTQVSAVTQPDSNVLVTWTDGSDGGASIVNHRVNVYAFKAGNRHSPAGTYRLVDTIVTGSSQTSYTVTGLNAHKSFAFTVATGNSVGYSVASAYSNDTLG